MSKPPSGTEPPSSPALRIKALESLLVEKGLVDPAAVGELIDIFEKRVGPRNGAKVVAKAWADPAYRQRDSHFLHPIAIGAASTRAASDSLRHRGHRPDVRIGAGPRTLRGRNA